MKLVRWDPLPGMVAMSDRLNRTADDLGTQRAEAVFEAWLPPVAIFESQDHLVVCAEVPGRQRGDRDVQFEDGNPTPHGEDEHDTQFELEMDSVYGGFTWSFSLPRKLATETHDDHEIDAA